MASSVDINSSNDITSTNNTSFPSVCLTTDAIIKECIKQGFYRNPICNEKLYLHNKGFDTIAPSAFEPYVDVKVLWLEGNGLSSMPCGSEYIQVQPPKRHDPFASSSDTGDSSEEEETASGDGGKKVPAHHMDPMRGLENDTKAKDKEGSTPPPSTTMDEMKKNNSGGQVRLPDAAAVPLSKRDAFSSLYPTVRQLYLHNNLFREMPDLSRFQRLDAVNLSNNFFSCVAPHCPCWGEKMHAYMEDSKLAPTISKSALQEQANSKAASVAPTPTNSSAKCKSEDAATAAAGTTGEAVEAAQSTEVTVVTLSPQEARKLREEELARYRQLVYTFSAFCPHEPIVIDDTGKLPDSVPRSHLNPCSSLRTLNLAGNHLEAFEDVCGLLCYKSLSVLDLSQNEIKDGEALLLILERLPRLRSLKLSGNPLVRTLPRYRKTVLARCFGLMHLDDRPVFEEERRLVNAWAASGEDGEMKERKLIKQETEEAQRRRLDDFRALILQHQAQSGPQSAYVAAITTEDAIRNTHVVGNGDVRGVSGGAAADSDDSPTSSDDDDEEETSNAAENAAAAIEPTAARAQSDRVLSCNRRVGSTSSPTTTAEATAAIGANNVNANEDDDEEEDEDDIYVPS